MSRFKGKSKKARPGISTASLPDIVIMLLFFFMVATVSKEDDPIVELTIPNAEECTKIEDKSLEAHINVGTPIAELQAQYGSEPRIQLNDAIKDLTGIPQFIEEKRQEIKSQSPDPELGNRLSKKMIVSLKVDQKSKIGVLDDIKQELRKMNALKVSYVVNNIGENY